MSVIGKKNFETVVMPYPPSSYSGITSKIHMKLGDKRFAKTITKWT